MPRPDPNAAKRTGTAASARRPDMKTRNEKKARTVAPAGRARAPAARGPRSGRRLSLSVAGIAVLAVGTLAGGVIGAAAMHDRPKRSRPAAGPPGPSGTPYFPGGEVTNVAEGGQVAPLQRVVPPDLLAVGARPIGQVQTRKIAKLKGVRDVVVVAGGAVQLQGRQINTFAVDPSRFRSWTPPGTAKKTELWTALAADQFVVSAEAARTLQLSVGTRYPIVAKTMPSVALGGTGSLGLPGVDLLVSKKTGTELGLIPDVAMMVNAPGTDPGKLTKSVTRLLGGGAQVLNLNEKKHQLPADGSGQAANYLDLYRKAATGCPGLSWTVLAAIGQVESNHGRNAGPSSAGALGPMQFLPSTWRMYGVDGDGDGKADIMNPYDAIPGAAKYLCASGAGKGGQSLYKAVFAYNHADWYVQKVLNLARAYAARYR